MLPTEWANSVRNAEYRQAPEDQQAINILESVLLSKQTPSEAALAINLIYEASIKSSNQQAVGIFWSIYSSAIRACGGDGQADKMTRLLIAIQSLPDIEDTSGSPVRDSNYCIYWRDLPEWHITFREYGIYIDGPGDFQGDWPWHEQVAPLLNATTFAAILLSQAPFRTGMEFHACTALSAALACPTSDLEDHQQAELYMPAAATWILIAGRQLRRACLDQLEVGHTLELKPCRWNEWRQRFDAIATEQGFSQSSQEWARRALSHMRTI